MQKKNSHTRFFIVFLMFSIFIFAISRFGVLKPIEPVFQAVFAPVEALVYNGYSYFLSFFDNSKVNELKKENLTLTNKIVDQKNLIEDNKALRDQFQTQYPKSTNLLQAKIIGAPGFIPGISTPEGFTIDKGEADGVRVGNAVVFEDNLVGIISKTTQYLSSVEVITNSSSSFTAKTLETNVLGVVKGQGGGRLILDNVVLSDSLKVGDVVLSKGDVNTKGEGIMPNLIVGKISAVSKIPSDLFQKAKILSNVNFSKLNTVFVVTAK